jgi:hypothetical protein
MGGVKFVDNCGAILAPHRTAAHSTAQHSNLQRWTRPRPRLRPRPLRMGGGLRAAKISARARANGSSGTEQSRNGAHATRFGLWDCWTRMESSSGHGRSITVLSQQYGIVFLALDCRLAAVTS